MSRTSPSPSPSPQPSPHSHPVTQRTPLRANSHSTSPPPALSPTLSPTIAHFPSSGTRSPAHSRSPSSSSSIRPPILIPSSPHPPPPPPATVLASELGLTPGISPPRTRSRPPSMYVAGAGAGAGAGGGLKSAGGSQDNLLDFFSSSTAQPGGHVHGSGSVSPARSRRTSRVGAGAKHAHSTSGGGGVGGRLPSPPPSQHQALSPNPNSNTSASPSPRPTSTPRLSQPSSSRPTSFFLSPRSTSPSPADPTSVLDPTTAAVESFDIFERDVLHTTDPSPSHFARMTAHEAVDVAIPPVLDQAAEAVTTGDSRVDEEVRGIIGAFENASIGGAATSTATGALAMNMGTASTSSAAGKERQPSIGAWLKGQGQGQAGDESDSDSVGGGGGAGVEQWGLTELGGSGSGRRRYYAPASSASPPGSVLSFPMSSPSPTSSPTSPRSLSPAPAPVGVGGGVKQIGTASPPSGQGLRILEPAGPGVVTAGTKEKDEGRRLSFVSLADIINSERTPVLGNGSASGGATSPNQQGTRHASPAISTASYGPWEFGTVPQDEELEGGREREREAEEEVLDEEEEGQEADGEGGEQFATLKARGPGRARRRLEVGGTAKGPGEAGTSTNKSEGHGVAV